LGLSVQRIVIVRVIFVATFFGDSCCAHLISAGGFGLGSAER
jgi:hypothetical protein